MGLVEPTDSGPAATRFADLIEENPNGVEWHTASETQYLLGLMSQLHREKVTEAQKSGRRMVGTVYRRTRPNTDGVKRQRASAKIRLTYVD